MTLIHDAKGAVPLTILTGFLGAGKTTLLNRILNGDHGLRIAVLVNDFGAINIDAELVVGVESDRISLSNGCVCCEIRDDLVATVDDVLARPEGPQYVLLEASGVANPGGIATTFVDPKYRGRIRLDSITTVVDTDQLLAEDQDPRLQRLKMLQIVFADMVILNKVDLAGAERVAEVRAWIDKQVNNIRFVETTLCDVPYEILMAVGRFDPARLDDAHDHHDHGHDHDPDHDQDHGDLFHTWSYRTDQPVSLEALRQTARKLPGSVYRCKGIVYSPEAPDRRAVLQVVGRRSDVTLLDGWNGSKPETRIVAIGAPGELDPDLLQERFDACIGAQAS